MKKLIAILLILSTPAYADQAIQVRTGEVITAPFDKGTLLDADKATKIKDQLIDGDACQKINTSFQKSVDLYKANEIIYNQENSLLLARNVDLSKTLNEAKTTSDWAKVGYFALGVVITGLAVYGAKQITR